MWFFNTMRVLNLLVYIAALVLAIRRPRTRQPLILTGLAMCVLGAVPDLPKLSTVLVTALYRPYVPTPDGNYHHPSMMGYYLFFGGVYVLQVVGFGLFGWAALTSQARDAGARTGGLLRDCAPWAQQGGQTGQWASQGQPGQQSWTPSGTTLEGSGGQYPNTADGGAWAPGLQVPAPRQEQAFPQAQAFPQQQGHAFPGRPAQSFPQGQFMPQGPAQSFPQGQADGSPRQGTQSQSPRG